MPNDVEDYRGAAVGGSLFTLRGDPGSYDFILEDLTTDELYHDLDLSPIVDVGTVLVNLQISLHAENAGAYLLLRKPGYTHGVNVNPVYTQVANRGFVCHRWVPCDTNRVIEYRLDSRPWNNINISVACYFV